MARSLAKSANGHGHWLQVLAMIGGSVIQSHGSWHHGSPMVPIGLSLAGSSIHTLLLLLFTPQMRPYWHRSCCPLLQSLQLQDSNGSHILLLLHSRMPQLSPQVS